MQKRFYNASSLRRVLDSYERRFAMTTTAFYDAYVAQDDEALAGIPRFMRATWASFYRDWRRLSGDDFAAGVERALECA